MTDDLVIIERFPDVRAAELAQSVLAGSEIESFLDVPYTGSMFPHYVLAAGWVSLFVRREDEGRAREVLENAGGDAGEDHPGDPTL